jgi:hypothetical protein
MKVPDAWFEATSEIGVAVAEAIRSRMLALADKHASLAGLEGREVVSLMCTGAMLGMFISVLKIAKEENVKGAADDIQVYARELLPGVSDVAVKYLELLNAGR